MKNVKQMTEAIAHIMVIPSHPEATDTREWLLKQCKNLPPHAFHAVHALAGAATRLVSDENLEYDHDETTLIFSYLQGNMADIILESTDAGTTKNPMRCGLWAAPVCNKCKEEGKIVEYCPVAEYDVRSAKDEETKRYGSLLEAIEAHPEKFAHIPSEGNWVQKLAEEKAK